MSDGTVVEVEGREVGVLVPEGDVLVFRSRVEETAHLDGYAFSEAQSAYSDIVAGMQTQPAPDPDWNDEPTG